MADSPARTASHFGAVALAFGLLLIHNLDEGFWHKEAGGKIATVGVFAIAVITLFAYPRLGRVARAALVGVLGVLAALVSGAGHIAHFFTGKVEPIDYSGILFFLGGLLLLWVAISEFRNAGGTN